MKHGSGIKGREDKSSGIEIRIVEAFVKISPTEPLRLVKQAVRKNRNFLLLPDSLNQKKKNWSIKEVTFLFRITQGRIGQIFFSLLHI